MIRKVSFAAFALLSCTAAVAADDRRIRTLSYSPDRIVQVIGRSGIQSTIEFASDERIENVAVGDSSAWQITPNRRASLLFVKPLKARSRTNMTVVTDRRTYMFDLVAGDKFTTPLYAMKFSYPNEKPVQTAAQPVQQAASSAAPSATSAVMTAERLHFDWNSKGNGKLLPTRIFDDGSSLYMVWGKDTPLPAILTTSEDRKEGPINYRMSGEYIVISPVPANLTLRYGSKYAVLWPSHRVTPVQHPITATVGRVATASAAQPAPSQPAEMQSPTTQAQTSPAQGSVRLANMTSLYNDKLTDAQNER